MIKKKLFRWLKIVLIVYATIGITLYYLQEKILFHPTALAADYKYSFTEPFEEVNILYDSSTNFNIVQFKVKDTLCKGIVLYFHGNKENINRYAPFANNFTKNGYETWMIDYPSFGKSTGKLNEGILYEEALQLYKMASAKFHADSIVLYGKSMGTGIASQLASTQRCRQLILETPYYSITSMANRYAWIYPVERMIKYKLPTCEYFKNVKVPITIFHGTDDGVVAYSNACKLKMVMKPSDKFITIENGTHNNLSDFPLFHQKLDSLLNH